MLLLMLNVWMITWSSAVGTHSVSVSINAPDGCSVSGSSLVNVTVSAKQEETTTKADNTANTNNNPTQQTTAKQ